MSDLGAFLASSNARQSVRTTAATVVSVLPLSIVLDGSTTTIPDAQKLGSYSAPTVGDRVWVLIVEGAAVLILGNVS